MFNDRIADLAQCTEFRQTLLACPPRVVHGAAALLGGLLAAALLWAHLTEADLVVRAPGVVRPVTSTQSAKARFGGRVVRVCFREGQEVHKGDVLVQLDTEKLDNDVKKRTLTLRASEEELAKMATLLETLARQFEAEQATIEAKLAQALEEVSQAKQRRDQDIRQAEYELADATREEVTMRNLVAKRAAASTELVKAAARASEARTKLMKARIATEEGKVDVLRKELVQARATYALKRQEQEMKQAAKLGEVEAARKELANLLWERDQATVRAPAGGVVVSGDLKEGDILEANAVVAEVAAQEGFRFEATVPCEEVGHLRVGMPVRVKLDPFDYQRYGTLEGRVCFLSEDSKVVEQRGNIYMVKAELDADEVGHGDFHGRVKLGMTGRAEIVTGKESVLSLLVKKVRQTISLG
jgi:multidrug efflux pump subunit AcrA (membrane-fusion protein)